MKPRFEPDRAADVSPDQESLIDPDECDVSEQQFSASLETRTGRPRFVVDESAPEAASGEAAPPSEASAAAGGSAAPVPTGSEPEPAPPELRLEPGPGAWRQELAARVNSYRARRRSPGPRYPSLRLQFEEPECQARPRTEGTLASKSAVESVAAEPRREAASSSGQTNSSRMALDSPPAETARIIEFPRSVNAPPRPLEELAEPVFDRPRILEAPEVALPPPALGGILIEAVDEPSQEKRPGFEMPLQPAPMPRRLLASGIDALLVVSAFALFAYIFFRVTSAVPRLPQLLGAIAGLLALFWVAYQYLLLVHAGTTPGLKLTRLELDCFDGSPAKQSLRRWRVLASVLSGASLGLGYAWCFLDEDQLCWHDRITRTYMAPRPPKTTQ